LISTYDQFYTISNTQSLQLYSHRKPFLVCYENCGNTLSLILSVIFSLKTISGVLRKLWQYFVTYTVSNIHVGSCLNLWFFIKYAPFICYIYLSYNSFVFVLSLFVWWMDCYRWPSDVCITSCG